MSHPNRFDYVAYDEESQRKQAVLKEAFQSVEEIVDRELGPGRYHSLVLTELEKAYMWVGKQIRDDQIARNGSAELQEQRGDS